MNKELAANTTFSHYRILSKIGAGGMGEVYLAKDASELERTVAIKLLPTEVASDTKRMQRFILEAKTLSALNHPNILTIQEFGQDGETRFIATEYVAGVTLRQHMRTHRMKLHEVLDIAMQIAAALDAAHEARVVHRDIKPENVMVRERDHIVKVLDFGLARRESAAADQLAADPEAETELLVQTERGVLIGTVAYMSPEQSQGAPRVDHRTDIWSLGVLLYELITGRLPFEGKDVHRQIIAIQEMEPAPLARFAEGIPERLEEIVGKALAKNVDERYQTAKDLLIDLRNLKRRLDVEAEIERTLSPEVRAAGSTTSSQSPTTSATAAETSTTRPTAAQSTSNAEYLLNEIKQHKRGVLVTVAVVVLTMIAAGTGVIYFNRSSSATINSIAVLPFVNESGDENVNYLSDGITESLINSLARVSRLRVISRSTAFQYKGRQIVPSEAGSRLNVSAVLTGRVVRRDDTLTIQADLIDVATDTQLWGERYNRKPADILLVQEEIAREILDKLRLTGEEQKVLARRDTINPEAYEFYLKGRYHLEKGTEKEWREGQEYFRRALQLDPNYALAHVGLADAYNRASAWLIPPKQAMPKVKEEALQALRIDEGLAEAHVMLAVHEHFYEKNYRTAEQEFKRALALKPNSVDALVWYCFLLARMERFDEAIATVRQAQNLEPLSIPVNHGASWVFYYSRQFDLAIEQLEKALEVDSNNAYTHDFLGQSYRQKERYAEALAEFTKAKELGDDLWSTSALGTTYAMSGRRDEALKMIGELREIAKGRYVSPYFTAIIYAALGDREQTFVWLEKAMEEKNDYLAYLKVEPLFDRVRSDPRFADLVQRVGL